MNSEQLLGLPVETQSGQDLGKVKSFDLDMGTLKVIEIIVSPSGIVKKLVEKDLHVSVSNIIDVTAEKIIVEDTIVKTGGRGVKVGDYKPSISPASSSTVINSK